MTRIDSAGPERPLKLAGSSPEQASASALEAAVARAAALPGAYGALLCDFEGEAVFVKVGTQPLPEDVRAAADRHVPTSIYASVSVESYLLRLIGAEPCALIALFDRPSRGHGGGRVERLELAYERVGLVVDRLPEDYYLVIVLARRPGLAWAKARRMAQFLAPELAREVG